MAAGQGQEVINGKDESGNEEREGSRVMATRCKRKYGSHPDLVVPDATANVNLLTYAPTAFSKMTKAHHLSILSTTDITVRLNAIAEDPIKVRADIPWESDAIEFDALFLSNASGGPAVVDVVIV